MYALYLTAMLIAAPDVGEPILQQYRWEPTPQAREVALFRDGKKVGVWRYATSEFYPLDGMYYGTPRNRPPVDPPHESPPKSQPLAKASESKFVGPPDELLKPAPNYGIDVPAVPRERTYSENGRQITEAEAYDRLRGKLSDDSTRPFLVVLGPKESTAPVLKDIESNPKLASVKENWHVKELDPSNPRHKPLLQVGHKSDGNPTIYCQLADGKVAHRQDGYDPVNGAENLGKVCAIVEQQVRKADPNYKPIGDPNLNEPATKIPPLVIAVGAAGIFFLFRFVRNRQQPAPAV